MKEATGILDYLKGHCLVTDGAMGTYYSAMCGEESLVSEWGNIPNRDMIFKIHTDYLTAGANLIRTNTFAANRRVLSVTEKEQKKILREAVKIAKEAVTEHLLKTGKQAFVAGDIGPISSVSVMVEEENILAEYQDMIDCFLEEGVDAILFETFPDVDYLDKLTAYIAKKAPDVFCMAQFSLNPNGFTLSGLSAQRVIGMAAEIPNLSAIGFNCGVGSGHMLRILQKVRIPENKYFAVSPNAGYPEQMQSRMVFLQNTDYFYENMKEIAGRGVSILGACCGSNPSYIEKISEIVKNLPPVSIKETAVSAKPLSETGKDDEISYENNDFYRKLLSGKKVCIVEVDPPFDAVDDKIIACAEALKDAGVDMLTVADSPQGKSRMDSVLTAVRLKNVTGMTVLPHLSCRDRNMIAMRSVLLGAYANEVRNFLFVTGDPVPSDARANTTAVFDYNSMHLMSFARGMNLEHFAHEPIVYGGAINQGRINFDVEIRRTEKKIAAGAKFFLTQPVYSDEDIRRLRMLKERTGTKLLIGILPLISYRNANFLKNEMVGIDVPDDILHRYSPDMTREEGEETGAEISVGIMEKVSDFADGFYFMLPFNRVSVFEKIMKKRKEFSHEEK